MQKIENNPRRDFLKQISIATVSISAVSLFKFIKSNKYYDKKFSTLSKFQADEIIKNEKFTVPTELKPSPAPTSQKPKDII
jgi:hypothetical protein